MKKWCVLGTLAALVLVIIGCAQPKATGTLTPALTPTLAPTFLTLPTRTFQHLPTFPPIPTPTASPTPTPTATPAPILAVIKLETTYSSFWEERNASYDRYDIRGTVKQRLKKAGFEVAEGANPVWNARLLVDYSESSGERYSPGGVGTEIRCYIRLHDDLGNLLFEHALRASTSPAVLSGGLRANAISNFERNVYFKYLGDIIASRMGFGDEVSILISALEDEGAGYSAAILAET